MVSRPNLRTRRHPRRRKRRGRRRTLKTLWRFARWRWRESRTFLRAVSKTPPTTRMLISAALLLVLLLTVNWVYHAFYKPTEVFFPLDDALDKNPVQTWKEYGSLFREHSTAVITPELLAALAQVEGAGNPVARTYWRWHLSWNPLEWYQPASSAVGMFQITDGTFQEARRYCIHDHVVVEDGQWNDMKSCLFNNLYTRTLPSHAIELTAALLDHGVAKAMGQRGTGSMTLQKKQDLAAVIHLCGAGAGHDFVRRGFRLKPHQRCGNHDVRTYLTRVNVMKQQFVRLTTAG
ncbi:MAG: transglycosylase SLT domain-containing protein [Nitrospirae bacterium]|nr:transglycosylase SLT domain-containing protein [Nitrospirota bacterium]